MCKVEVGEKTVALQKVAAPGRDFVVTPGAGFHGVPFIIRRFRSGVVTDLDKSYVQKCGWRPKNKQTRSSPQIREVFGQIMV